MSNSRVFASIDAVINRGVKRRQSLPKGVQTVVIGDVRDIRQGNDIGSTNNQKIHQWSFGSIRHKLTYKAERRGLVVALQDEHATSRRCPVCRHLRKSNLAVAQKPLDFHPSGVSPNQELFYCHIEDKEVVSFGHIYAQLGYTMSCGTRA
jgi:IS605 OrfB family transposase